MIIGLVKESVDNKSFYNDKTVHGMSFGIYCFAIK